MSDLNSFLGDPLVDPVYAPEVCEQRRLRIKLALAAYAYEYHASSIMSDGNFDAMCKKIDTSIDTGYRLLDRFFREEFSPDTGQWVHKHPEKDKLEWLYQRYYGKSKR